LGAFVSRAREYIVAHAGSTMNATLKPYAEGRPV